MAHLPPPVSISDMYLAAVLVELQRLTALMEQALQPKTTKPSTATSTPPKDT